MLAERSDVLFPESTRLALGARGAVRGPGPDLSQHGPALADDRARRLAGDAGALSLRPAVRAGLSGRALAVLRAGARAARFQLGLSGLDSLRRGVPDRRHGSAAAGDEGAQFRGRGDAGQDRGVASRAVRARLPA